jgi:hypothetical protein
MNPAGPRGIPKNASWRLVDLVQKIPQEYRWVFNDHSTLMAVHLEKPTVRTGKMAILKSLIKYSKMLGMEWQLIYIVGLFSMIKMLASQFFVINQKSKIDQNYPSAFFVGFSVTRNEQIYLDYCDKTSEVIGKFNQYDIGSFARWCRVNFQMGMYFLAYSITIAKKAIASMPPELSGRREDFLSHVASKLGYYAYMRSWFHMVRRINPRLKEIAFSCQNIASFAAVDEGIHTIYFSHGLLSHAELLPAFNKVTVISNAEMEFVKCRLPDSSVATYINQIEKLNPSRMLREVLICSYPSSENKYMSNIITFLDFAKVESIKVRVRLHPSENDNVFWHKYQEAGLVSIEVCDISVNDALVRLKPRLVLSWGSTTLIDALDHGVIPINASRDDDLMATELVYPVRRRSLRLDRHFKSLPKLFHDDDYYNYVLSKLYSSKVDDVVQLN